MRYREIAPTPPLQSLVQSFWTLDHDGASAVPQRVVPDGHPELILNLSEPFEFFQDGQWHRQPRCFFAGQIRGPLLLRPNGRARILGIRFTPHGAAGVLNAPMHELAGRFTPVANVSRELYRALDRALESPNPIPAVESALLRAEEKRRTRDTLVAEAVQRIALSRGALSISDLAADLGVGNRQFERRFNAGVGLPPKLFCRLQRFVQVFRVIGAQTPQWVETAVDCGYYDQAHLIRDFKSFSGETPAILLAHDADLARHFLTRFGVSHSYNTNGCPAV